LKTIPLFNDRGVVLVDDADYEWLSQYTWSYLGRGYATTRLERKGPKVLMHRVLMGVEGRHNQVDHINGNKLDNRRSNLRRCTNAENHRNMRKPRRGSIPYKGVRRMDTKNDRYYAIIRHEGKNIYLGKFDTMEQAALAYNKAATEMWGEWAYPNVIPSPACSGSAPSCGISASTTPCGQTQSHAAA
jgi:hypothetical protein